MQIHHRGCFIGNALLVQPSDESPVFCPLTPTCRAFHGYLSACLPIGGVEAIHGLPTNRGVGNLGGKAVKHQYFGIIARLCRFDGNEFGIATFAIVEADFVNTAFPVCRNADGVSGTPVQVVIAVGGGIIIDCTVK